jgi:molybdate transport system ATP-binding protein
LRIEVEAAIGRPSGFQLDARFACDSMALGLVGPSGSGKSTLLDAIAGIERGARVVLDGEDCSRVPLARRRVGYVTQDALLFPHLTVRQNLSYSPRAGPIDDVARALRIDGLLDRMPRHLSGGERRRAALARAIASRPRLLLLDEPFSGLDEMRRRDAMSLLAEVGRTFRVPMVIVSHWADEIIGLTDWALRLEEGRIIAAGPSATLLRGGETRIDNYLGGRVAGRGRVEVEGVELAAMIPEGVEGPVRVACYAHDILLGTREPRDLSARNVLEVTVLAVPCESDPLLLEVGPPRLRVLVTRAAADSLGLVSGARAYAVIKATSLVYLGAA